MIRFLAPMLLLVLTGCATTADRDPQSQFFSRLGALCGRAFEGRIVSPPAEGDSAFAGRRLVMFVRDCGKDEIRIPFQVGEDHSRTWVVTRTSPGLRLKHDHRHEDGTEDRLSRYGGDAAAGGSAARQEFPADDETKALFVRENIPQSITNVWALEVRPGATFAYELRRPGRFFRVEFDLTRPLPAVPGRP
jgi:hypothetical protein